MRRKNIAGSAAATAAQPGTVAPTTGEKAGKGRSRSSMVANHSMGPRGSGDKGMGNPECITTSRDGRPT